MNKKRIGLGIVALLVLVGLVVGGAVASVYAYRQLKSDNADEPPLALDTRLSPARQSDDGQEDERPLSEQGVLVIHLDPDSPAAEAGLRRGSIILAVDGEDVNTPRDLQAAVQAHEAGDTITLTVLQCDAPQDIEVTLASAGPFLGVGVAGTQGAGIPGGGQGAGRSDVLPPGHPVLPPESFPALPDFPDGVPGFDNRLRPAIVFDVVPDSPAAEVGLSTGDIITQLDGEEVLGRDRLAELIGQKSPGDEVVLTVQRGEETLTLTVTLTAHPEDDERGYLGIYLSPMPRIEQRLPAPQNS